jgi:hypothetical protein
MTFWKAGREANEGDSYEAVIVASSRIVGKDIENPWWFDGDGKSGAVAENGLAPFSTIDSIMASPIIYQIIRLPRRL